MQQQRARMKPGVRPIIIDCAFVPEYPMYWAVPESASAAVELLAADGQVEYEPSFARGVGGHFAPQVALTAVAPVVAAPAGGERPFARRKGGGGGGRN